MQTITLKVSDKTYDHLIWFLKRFRKDELEIVRDDFFQNLKDQAEEDFQNAKVHPHLELSLEDFEKEMENTLKKYGA